MPSILVLQALKKLPWISGLLHLSLFYIKVSTYSAPRPELGPQINLCICKLLRGLSISHIQLKPSSMRTMISYSQYKPSSVRTMSIRYIQLKPSFVRTMRINYSQFKPSSVRTLCINHRYFKPSSVRNIEYKS